MDRAEFERKALDQLEAVHRLAYHLTRNGDAAGDLVQEVYLRAFRPKAVARFEERPDSADEDTGSSIRSWLFTITHNTFYSKVKRDQRAPVAVGEFYSDAADGPAPDESGPAWDRATLDWEQVDGALKEAIADLKPEYREILLMWGVDGLKYREIAEILEVPIGTIMSRLHRARKLVAEKLQSDERAREDLGLDRV
ncbi:MAG: sigma-70 family RNA polymerase sigma factor [Planctomycetota bacterium]